MNDRTEKEMISLFKDPKFARHAWRSVGLAIVQNPCQLPVGNYDKDGEQTLAGAIEEYSYKKLKRDIDNLTKDGREPTELEMIMQCQIVKARFDTPAAIFVRDTLGAKPVDESKLDAQINNPYESLSDEELTLIADARAAKLSVPATPSVPSEDHIAIQSSEQTQPQEQPQEDIK